MAVTRIHPIRRTLSLALKYITDPNKTEEKTLVSAYKCSLENADKDFMRTASKGRAHGTVVAQHIIQSFKPGETDAKTAHEIGMELAKQFTNGEHEFILSTHVDKGHIHNHIIFNQTNFVNFKKFRMNKNAYYELRDISDELCLAHNLSVIKDPKGKGISHFEWQMRKSGKSYKQKMAKDLDVCMNAAATFDDFLAMMQLLGYELKNAKTLAFRAADYEQFVSTYTINKCYSEDAIRALIASRAKAKTQTGILPTPKTRTGIQLLIKGEISKMENKRYANKIAIENIERLTKTYNFLKTENLDSLSSIREKEKEVKNALKNLNEEVLIIDDSIEDLKEYKKKLQAVMSRQKLYDAYVKSGKSEQFYKEHKVDLMIYKVSKKGVQESPFYNALKSVSQIEDKISALKENKSSLLSEMKGLEEKESMLRIARKNVEVIFNSDRNKKEKEQSKKKDRN